MLLNSHAEETIKINKFDETIIIISYILSVNLVVCNAYWKVVMGGTVE